MRRSTSSWLRQLDGPRGPSIPLSKLEALVERHVNRHFSSNPLPSKRRDPAFGGVCYTVFNLRGPIIKWVRRLRTPEGARTAPHAREALLGRMIQEHLRRPPRLIFQRRPLPPESFYWWEEAPSIPAVVEGRPDQGGGEGTWRRLLSAAGRLVGRWIGMMRQSSG